MNFRRVLLFSAAMFAAIDARASNDPAEPPPRSLSKLVRELISSPDSPALHFEIGQAYFRQGVMAQSEKEFLTAIRLAQKKQPQHPGVPGTLMVKGYLRAVRAQRPMGPPEIRILQDLRQSDPGDAESAKWMLDVHLEKGDTAAARVILARFPQLKQNADVLAKWVRGSAGTGRPTMAHQEEQFKDLMTLMEVGGERHQLNAAKQLIDVACRMPPAAVSATQRQAVHKSFERILASSLPDTGQFAEEIRVYRRYLTLLELWKERDRQKPLIMEMRKRFPDARSDPDLLLRSAELDSENKKYEDAMAALREAFRLGLETGSARLLMASLLERVNRPEDAIREYAAALENVLLPAERDVAMTKIQKWISQAGQRAPLPPAFDSLSEKISNLLPMYAPAQILWAKRLESSGRKEDAFLRYETAFKIDNRARDARMGLARTAIQIGRASEAAVALQKLDAADVKELWIQWKTPEIGRRLMALGETEPVRRTVRGFTEPAGSAHATPEQLTFAAEMLIAEGKFQEATGVYELIRRRRGLSIGEADQLSRMQDQIALGRAESLYAAGKFPEALDLYESMPDSASAQVLLRRATCLAQTGRAAEAITLLEKTPAGLEQQASRSVLLAGLYEQTGAAQKAEMVYRSLAQMDTRNLSIDAAKKLAAVLSSRQRWSDAIPLLDRIAGEPGMTAADKMAWARGKIRVRDFSEAERISAFLRELVRDMPEAYTLLGEFESATGNRGAAQAAFQQALNANPDDEAAASGMAEILRESGDRAQAVDLLLRLKHKSPLVCRFLSRLYAEQNQWEQAAVWLENGSVESSDRTRGAWYWLKAGLYDEASELAPKGGLMEAVIEAEAGKIEKLRKLKPELLSRVIGETPRKFQKEKSMARADAALLDIARRRAKENDHEAVLKICDSLLSGHSARPHAAEAQYLKGTTLLRMGFYDRAKKSLDDAAQSSEWSVPANLRLGQLELMRGRPVDALVYLDQAGPGSDPSELILAWGTALALSKSPEQGEDILRQLSKKSPRAKFFLARLMEDQGRAKEARETYLSILDRRADAGIYATLADTRLKTLNPLP